MNDAWYKEVIRGICIGLLSGSTVKFLSDAETSIPTNIIMVLSGVGLIILSRLRDKK